MKKSRLFLIVSLLVFLFSGCEVGLGNAVDLEAPVITITSPLPQSNVKKNVLLQGTCTDNLRVTEVVVSNKITGEDYGKAQIFGETWKIQLTLEEGEVELVCQAKDAANNSSTKSTRTILLLVDETAPEGLSWYIERGKGIQVALQSKQALEQTDLDEPTNKYIPQNEAFTIHGNFYDAMSIDTITLTLSENGNPIISKTIAADSASPNYIGDGKSIFAPAFKFTHDELVSAYSALSTGKHYLQVSFFSQDDHKNSVEETLPYVLWYPESDIPGIMQAATINENLSVNVGSSIFLHFFDDDELVELDWDFITNDDFTSRGITLQNFNSAKDSFTNKKNSQDLAGISDYPTQISAGETTGLYYLLVYAKDINGKERARIIKTVVADATYPMLIIDKPTENTVPDIKAGTTSTFEISGYSYDTAGSKNIKIAYVPGKGSNKSSTELEARAKEIFTGSTLKTGEKYLTYPFPVVKEKAPNDNWYIEAFNFEFDSLDFGAENITQKFFEIALEDTDGNIVYKQFNISADTKAPDIIIASPADNMIVCDYRNNNLTLRFKAEKASGLGIKQSGYKIERMGFENTINWTFDADDADSEGYYQVEIQKSVLKDWAEGTDEISSDTQPIFVFYAEDVLGNVAKEQRTVVLSPLPVLEKIITDSISKTYPANTQINIQAKFSDSVRVIEASGKKPRIKLDGITGTGAPYYAVYSSGSLSDTLTFTFTVPDNEQVTATHITCIGVDNDTSDTEAAEEIDLNGCQIVTNVEGTGDASIAFVSNANFWEDTAPADVKKSIGLDGIAPVVQSITPNTGFDANEDGNWYVNANKDIKIELEFSENVLVTGSPKITYNGIDFSFQSMQGSKVTFAHKVINGENASLVLNSSGFSNQVISAIQDSAGNKMKFGTLAEENTVVIDTNAPASPSVIGIIEDSNIQIENGKVYNNHPEITVTAADSSDTVKLELSTNGGLSWEEYNYSTTNGPLSFSHLISEVGNFIITARATDKAGNISNSSSGIEITINDTFPVVNEISVARADGKYKEGVDIDFKVFLQDEVEAFPEGYATLQFTGINSGNTITRTIHSIGSSVATNKVVFRYPVHENDYFDGVQITSVTLEGIQDKYKNQESDATRETIEALLSDANYEENFKRAGILLDGTAPRVVSYKLGNSATYTYGTDKDKISSASNDENSFSITLIFDDNIIKESGTITLQRKGEWAIPPVMDSTTFLKWYNKIEDDDDKQILMQTDSDGIAITHSQTGQPVGPYQKITHGLDASGAKAVPDKATKYVLDFQYGLYDATGTVKNIRNVLSSVDYDKHFAEVRNVIVNDNTVTITFPDAIEDGQNWELIIPDDSFHDETGNYFKGLKSEVNAGANDYKLSLWSDKVAAPVVRVERYSHGLGAYGLNAQNNEILITGHTTHNATNYARNSGSNLKPRGYANVRIDCETPGVDIYYKNIPGGTAVYNQNTHTAASPSSVATITDINSSSLIFDTGGTQAANGVTFKVGDYSNNATDTNRYLTARKDYVSAYAVKDGFDQSENGYEGIFKTIIVTTLSGKNQINIEGGTAPGGEPIVSGFPVRDATSDIRYEKNAYNTGNNFVWVSYEIITNWAYLEHSSNYSKTYPSHSYGQLLYVRNLEHW